MMALNLKKKYLNKKIKNTVLSYCQYLLVVGRCWLAIWNCSKHMKIGSYISHSQIWWNLLLIMLLIPELYRAPTVTVFQTEAGKKIKLLKQMFALLGLQLSTNAHKQVEQTLGGKR